MPRKKPDVRVAVSLLLKLVFEKGLSPGSQNCLFPQYDWQDRPIAYKEQIVFDVETVTDNRTSYKKRF